MNWIPQALVSPEPDQCIFPKAHLKNGNITRCHLACVGICPANSTGLDDLQQKEGHCIASLYQQFANVHVYVHYLGVLILIH